MSEPVFSPEHTCSSEPPKRGGFSVGEVVSNNGRVYVADEFGFLIGPVDVKAATTLSYIIAERKELRVRLEKLQREQQMVDRTGRRINRSSKKGQMSDEQINAAIAEACGWMPDLDHGICWNEHGNPIITYQNYCNDLNAMHEAEKIIKKAKPEYAALLIELVSIDAKSGIYYAYGSFPHVTATARQRAEAFLRTLGLWEEAK